MTIQSSMRTPSLLLTVQKVLIALYENATPFEPRLLGPAIRPQWPSLRRFGRSAFSRAGGRRPRRDGGEHHHRASRAASSGAGATYPRRRGRRADVRLMDRFSRQLHHDTAGQDRVRHIRAAADRDPLGVAEARAMLDTAYAWLDKTMAGRQWAAGDTFSLADCAAAPALFYADWTYPIGPAFENVHAYRRRLLKLAVLRPGGG